MFFGSKDRYLNKASVKYLENRLYDLAVSAARYSIDQNIPTKPKLSDAEQAELEEFLSNIKVLAPALGHKLFENLEETVEDTETESQDFYCKNGAGAEGAGRPSTEGFIMFKGSKLMVAEQGSLADSIRLERQRMLSEGVLVKSGEFYQLTKDYVFTSSSRAASATLARSASGPLEWKTLTGIQLKHFETLPPALGQRNEIESK
ncbi:DUF4357 domain-containing protein [Pedobacter yulinensis]|nr:DUF4357 domain-containing protein [Pedobacter yulinensis]